MVVVVVVSSDAVVVLFVCSRGRVNPCHGPTSQAATLEKSPMRTKLRQIPFRPGTYLWDLSASGLRFLTVPEMAGWQKT